MIFNCKLNRVDIRGMLARVAIAAEVHAQEFKHGMMGGGACQIEKGSRTVDMRSTSQLSGHAIASCKSPTPLSSLPSFTQPFMSFMLIFSTGDSVSSVTGEAAGLHHRGPTWVGAQERSGTPLTLSPKLMLSIKREDPQCKTVCRYLPFVKQLIVWGTQSMMLHHG